MLRPARVAEEDLRAGRFVLRNMLDFTNLREFLSITYTVRQNGQDVYEGSLSEEALDLAPHARKEIQIAYPKDLQGDFAVLFTCGSCLTRRWFRPAMCSGSSSWAASACRAGARRGRAGIERGADGAPVFIDGENFHYVYDKARPASMCSTTTTSTCSKSRWR